MIRTVCVNETSYQVQERAGVLKAFLNGLFGWDSVWISMDTPHPYEALVRRIKRVYAFGPMENLQ
jgi:hypothetical protein